VTRSHADTRAEVDALRRQQARQQAELRADLGANDHRVADLASKVQSQAGAAGVDQRVSGLDSRITTLERLCQRAADTSDRAAEGAAAAAARAAAAESTAAEARAACTSMEQDLARASEQTRDALRRVADLDSTLDPARDARLDRLERTVDSLAPRLDDLGSAARVAQEEVDGIAQRLTDADGAICTQILRLTNRVAEVESSSQQAAAGRPGAEELREVAAQAGEAISAARDAASQAVRAGDKGRDAVNQVLEVSERLRAAEAHLAQVAASVTKAASEAGLVGDRLGDVHRGLERLQFRVSDVEARLVERQPQDVQRDIQALDARVIAASESWTQQLQQYQQEVREQVDNIQGVVSQGVTRAVLAHVEGRLDGGDVGSQDLRRQIASLSSSVDDKIARLDNDLGTLRRNVDRVSEDIGTQVEERLSQYYEDISGQLENIKSTLEQDMKADIGALSRKVDQSTSRTSIESQDQISVLLTRVQRLEGTAQRDQEQAPAINPQTRQVDGSRTRTAPDLTGFVSPSRSGRGLTDAPSTAGSVSSSQQVSMLDDDQSLPQAGEKYHGSLTAGSNPEAVTVVLVTDGFVTSERSDGSRFRTTAKHYLRRFTKQEGFSWW